MMKKILLIGALLSGCAATEQKQDGIDYHQFISEQKLQTVNRVQHFNMSGWQALDSEFFILRVSQRRNYLIEVMGFCNNLPYAQSLAFKQDFHGSLQAKFNEVIVLDSMQNQRCTIKNIYPLSLEQKKALTVR